MKKFSSILIVLTIILNMFCIQTIASGNQSADDSYYSKAYRLLEDLELASPDEDADSSVTRGEFVSRVVKALNIDLSFDYSVSPYADISPLSPFYYEICNAYSWGLISPAEKFNPDRSVSYTEAIKIAVSACGYDFLAKANGGWPTGYIAAASKTGLDDGVPKGDINKGSMFVILYNILNCELPEPEYTGEGIVNTMNSSKTLLQTFWHLEKISGKADGAQFFGGEYGNGVGEGLFSVDGIVLKSGKFNTDKCFALEVEVYYDSTYTAKSIYTSTAENKKDIIVLNSYDDVTFKAGVYTYYDNSEKQQSVKIAGDALIVYNGKKSDYVEERMMPEYGTVKLIKQGGAYNVVIINSYEQFIADEIIYDDYVISDLHERSKTLSLENAQTLTVYDQNGNVGEFSDIEHFNIVWIAESEDKTIADVIISRDKIVGEYTGSSGFDIIYIDGGKYTKDKNVAKDIMAKISYGDVIVAYFNANREIVHVEFQADAEAANVAYLIQSALIGTGLNRTMKARMLLSNGSIETYDIADKLTVNGLVYTKQGNGEYNAGTEKNPIYLPKDNDNPISMLAGLVSYTLDSKNKLSAINYADSYLAEVGGDYANLYTQKSLDKSTDQGNSWDHYFQYRPSEYSFYGKGINRIFAKDNTVQFIVPVSKDISLAEDSDYIVKKMSSYTGLTYLTQMIHTGYAFDEDSFKSDFIVSTFEIGGGANLGSVPATELAYLVTSMSQVITANGDYADKLVLVDYQNRVKELYSEEENFFVNAGVSEGSIIKANFNAKSVVSDIEIIYKPGDKKFSNITTASSSDYKSESDGAIINENSGMGALSDSFLLLANVWDKEDPIYSFLPMNIDPEAYDGSQPVYTFHMPNHIKQFVCYNTKTGKTSYIKPTDVKCYGGVGGNNHYAVVEMAFGMTDSVFLYE